MSLDRQFDFDYIVIGSGFGGSVSALRLAEKGYRVAVMEMGRRWTPREPAAHQLVDSSLVLAAAPRVARLLQHAILPPCHHPARLRGRRRFHHLCQYLASRARQSVGHGLMGGIGRLESRRCRSITILHRECWASSRTGFSAQPTSAEKGGRGERTRPHLLSHARRNFPVCRRRAGSAKPTPTRSSAARVRSEALVTPAAAA